MLIAIQLLLACSIVEGLASLWQMRGVRRLQALEALKPCWAGALRPCRWAYVLPGRPTSWISLQATLRAAFSLKIRWQ